MSPSRHIDGTVLILQCERCNRTFPHFRFGGDESDTAIIGLGTITSCDKNEIIISEMAPEEWNAQNQDGLLTFERRLSQELRRDDLRVVRLLRVEPQQKLSSGTSFKEFLKTYARPVLTFSCACCTDGKSVEAKEMTVQEFRGAGGLISATRGLAV